MYVFLCTEGNKLLPVPSNSSCLCSGAAGSTDGSGELSRRQAPSVSHTLWVQHSHAAGFIQLKNKKYLYTHTPVTGISVPDIWQLYKTRFDYLSLKSPSSRVVQFWYQLLCWWCWHGVSRNVLAKCQLLLIWELLTLLPAERERRSRASCSICCREKRQRGVGYWCRVGGQ